MISGNILKLEPNEQLRMATQLLDRLQAQIRGTDEKIRALFSANTLLAAALAFTNQGNLPSLPGIWEWVILSGSILMLMATVGSVVLALFALLPRVQSSGRGGSFFFADIAGQSLDIYLQRFTHLDAASALEQVLVQIHDVSRIACVKHRWMRRAGLLLIVALALWFAILVTNLASKVS